MATHAQHRFLTADEFAHVDLGPDVRPIDLEIRSLGITLPHAEIFARD